MNGVQGPSRLLNHAHSLTVARMVSLPSQISAFCARAARSPCICSHLRVALRVAQQPTGLTLPSGALRVALGLRPKCPQGTRFPSRLPGFGAEPQSLMPQHFPRALRASEGRKKRGSFRNQGFFNGLRSRSTPCAPAPAFLLFQPSSPADWRSIFSTTISWISPSEAQYSSTCQGSLVW